MRATIRRSDPQPGRNHWASRRLPSPARTAFPARHGALECLRRRGDRPRDRMAAWRPERPADDD